MKNRKNFETYYDELSEWMEGNDYSGGMEFAFRNGFDLHAVSCWINSGASALNLPVIISRKAELKEIKDLCAYADIFNCPSCNHHSFFSPGEIPEDETTCESCLKIMKIYSRGEK